MGQDQNLLIIFFFFITYHMTTAISTICHLSYSSTRRCKSLLSPFIVKMVVHHFRQVLRRDLKPLKTLHVRHDPRTCSMIVRSRVLLTQVEPF
ncbi:hypothetical protein BDC45DRAFT_38072 [Circinella umbellata]|nr:hypothetical protein BDC45DRAFT_38072 [Circinella umbellata]